MQHKWQREINASNAGQTIEFNALVWNAPDTWKVAVAPNWDLENVVYRVKPKEREMKVTKSNAVRAMLNENSFLTNKQIAQAVGCDVSLVGQLRRVKSVSKRGRPRKVVEAKQISIIEASNVLQYLVKDIKDLCISFDHSRNKLDVLWHEEIFQVSIDELPKAIDSIKFLANKEIAFSEVDHHDNI
jgi:hypothetical protein